MKDQFVDYETAEMLKELGFDEKCFAWYIIEDKTIVIEKCETNTIGVLKSPLWQQVEQWLWEKLETSIHVDVNHICKIYLSNGEEIFLGLDKGDMPFLSPITAKNKGIKAAVKHLHQQIKK